MIIAAAIGYTEPQVAPFFRSLWRTGYPGDVAFIVDGELAARLRGDPAYARCRIVVVPRWLPHRLRLGDRRQGWRAWRIAQVVSRRYLNACEALPLGESLRWRLQLAVARHAYWPTETRYLHAYEFLRSSHHERVLLTDVRDVLFQADPFAGLPRAGLAVGMETRRLTLATEPFNARQITLAYGAEGLRRIGGQPVSCSGVTYGDRASMLRYLRLMAGEIWKLSDAAARHPMDQALHNYILWSGRFGAFRELDTLDGPIATVATLDEAELRVSGAGRLLNRDGSVPPIVHQYDRFPRLAATLQGALAAAA